MQLTEHFADTELGVAGCEPRLVMNATTLCRVLLEPIRAKFGPLVSDDGYRDPAHNARVGGAADSQHLYLALNAAVDFRPIQADMQTAFDWIRLDSHLPFDQVILEYHEGVEPPTAACIHISYNAALTAQRRAALEGETNGAGKYTEVQVN